MNHRECNPLLESDRLDPSMDMYFLFTRLGCEYLADCSAQLSQAASASGYETSGHGTWSTGTRDRDRRAPVQDQ